MSLIDESKKYVSDFFIQNEHERFVYHNLIHTQKVVKRAKILSAESDLTDKEKELLFISAWFHDLGYLFEIENHEEKSVEYAKSFLLPKGMPLEDFEVVKEAILATKYPQKPSNKVARYLCDADMYHLSLENFFEISLLLRQEMKSLTNDKISKLKYWEETLQLFEDHEYHTPYGQKVLNPAKENNKSLLKHKITRQVEKQNGKRNLVAENKALKTIKATQEEEFTEKINHLERKFWKLKEPVRGIETMFRVTGRNQINLSAIADNKANIMISANVIVISLVLSTASRPIDDNPLLIIPALFILLTCLATIVFAVLSTRPNVATGHFSKEDIKNKKVNLMFFGNFYKVSYDEYEWGLKELMKDYDYLYETLIKDQYSLGVVLAKKYKFLRSAYTIFVIGFILSVIAFATVIFFT